MAKLVWDDAGKRFYEAGIDKGVLYLMDAAGAYPAGVAWNGLVSVTENPSGAEPTPLFADNIKYLNLISAEQFGVTVEAYTYPDEFAECDGSLEAGLAVGVMLGQQTRKLFGMAYRSLIGNDVEGQDLGYKIHLLYGGVASPSEKAFGTINESPEAITFSWEVTTTPVVVAGYRAVASIVIDSRTADATKLAAFELIIYGDTAVVPRLPLPAEVITLMTP